VDRGHLVEDERVLRDEIAPKLGHCASLFESASGRPAR
jgi:hypothetical protein